MKPAVVLNQKDVQRIQRLINALKKVADELVEGREPVLRRATKTKTAEPTPPSAA